MKRNWIKEVRTVQEVNRELVMRKLKISIEDYHDMWLDAGRHYLSHTLELPAEDVDVLVSSRLFWKWWYNQWQKWDLQFIKESRRENPELLGRLYDQLHDPSTAGFAPNKRLLAEMMAENVVDKLVEGAYE